MVVSIRKDFPERGTVKIKEGGERSSDLIPNIVVRKTVSRGRSSPAGELPANNIQFLLRLHTLTQLTSNTIR